MSNEYWAAAIVVWLTLISMMAHKTDVPKWVCSLVGFLGFVAVVAYGHR